jgi:O-antigen/teichoic acid export membrane protein
MLSSGLTEIGVCRHPTDDRKLPRVRELSRRLQSSMSAASPLRRSPRHLLAQFRSDSLIRNSVYIMAVTVVTSALGFVFWLVAARRFSASEVGLSAALVSAMTLVSLLSNLGINTALVQMLPRRASGGDWSSTLTAGMLCGTLSGIVAGLFTVIVLPLLSSRFDVLRHSLTYSAIFVAGVALTTATNLLDYACIAERKAEKTLVRNTVFSVVKIPLLLLPFVVALGAFGIFFSWVLSTAVTVVVAAAMIPSLRRGYQLGLAGVRAETRRLRGYIAGHHSINIGNFAPWWLLPVFVTVQVSTAATAYFYATWRVCGLLALISPSVASALTAEGANSPHEIWRIAARSQRTILLVLVPACIVFAATGHWILAAFGSQYATEGLALLLLFTVASIPDSIMDVWVGVLRVEGRLRFGSWLQLGTAGLALILAWFLLPPLGISGAGVGWLVSRLVGMALVGWDYRRQRLLRDSQPEASGPDSTAASPEQANAPNIGQSAG